MPDPVEELVKDPKEDKSTKEEAPIEGQAPKENKFEGKSTEEILKSYQELSKKLGEQGKELGDTKKEREALAENLKKWEQLGTVIESDPELFEAIKKKVETPEKGDSNGKVAPDESKLFIRDNIIDRFEERYGIKSLEPEKAKALRNAVGGHLQLMLDPYGSGENINDLMLKVQISRLPMYFENAYKLATSGDSEEQARLRGIVEASANNTGMIGSIPSSSANSKEVVLTDKQKIAAKKLGIAEKDYIEYLGK